MRYKVTASQNKLITELRMRKRIKEQDFINQAFSPTANEGKQSDEEKVKKPASD
jgi:hypothetical protein